MLLLRAFLCFCLANTANALADSAGRLGAKTDFRRPTSRVELVR